MDDLGIRPGDIYEDCALHPVLCMTIDVAEDEITGISLIAGSQPRSCSLKQWGVVKLALDDIATIKPILTPMLREGSPSWGEGECA